MIGCQQNSNGVLDVINMGLCIFSGPKWEDDTLNKINEVSILLNTYAMFDEYRVASLNKEIRNENNRCYSFLRAKCSRTIYGRHGFIK